LWHPLYRFQQMRGGDPVSKVVLENGVGTIQEVCF
jgi:hypothetical protein